MEEKCHALGRTLLWILDSVCRAKGKVELNDYSAAGLILATVARDVEENVYPLSELDDAERARIRSAVAEAAEAVGREEALGTGLALNEVRSALADATLNAVVRCACGK
jgi:hypothetical protein